jgi:hypothetical protein
VREGVDRQFLRDEPDVGEPVGVHPCIRPASCTSTRAVRAAGVRPDDDELGVARSLAQRDVERRGDRAGVGVGGLSPASDGEASVGWVRVRVVRTEDGSFVVSYGHWM